MGSIYFLFGLRTPKVRSATNRGAEQGSVACSPVRRQGGPHPHTRFFLKSGNSGGPLLLPLLRQAPLLFFLVLLTRACGTRPTEDDPVRSFFGGEVSPHVVGIFPWDVLAPRGLRTKHVGVGAILSCPCWSSKPNRP